MKRTNLLLVLAILALVALPLVLLRRSDNRDDLFGGADNRAAEAVKLLAPGYTPWFRPLFEPPSGEVSSMLFALQAALGAGVIGYYFGLARGRAQSRRNTPDTPCT